MSPTPLSTLSIGTYYHNVEHGKDSLGNWDKTTHAYWAKDDASKAGFVVARSLAIQHVVKEINILWNSIKNNTQLVRIMGMNASQKVQNKVNFIGPACNLCPTWNYSDQVINYIQQYVP